MNGGGGRGRLYTYRYTVTTRMTPALKWAWSYESYFNVSLIVTDKVTRQCPQTTTFLKRKEGRSGIEPRPLCLPAYNALPLGQNGSEQPLTRSFKRSAKKHPASTTRARRHLKPEPVRTNCPCARPLGQVANNSSPRGIICMGYCIWLTVCNCYSKAPRLIQCRQCGELRR